MSFFLGVLKIVIIFGTLVTLHELGHFLVAKACKVRVHKFSIGFGPKIFTKVKGDTEYSLRTIPFGGFVQLEGEDNRSDDEKSFSNKPAWQRMLIILAGATVNIIVAFVLYFGITTSMNIYSLSIIEGIDDNTIAYKSGLRNGDEIIAVNGIKTLFALQVNEAINDSDDMVLFTIKRDNKEIEKYISIPEKEVGQLGVAFSVDNEIAYVVDDDVASKAGIIAGDKIASINGISGLSITEYIDIIKENANNSIKVTVDRNGSLIDFNLTPVSKKVKEFDAKYKIVSNLNIFENSYYAINETSFYFKETLKEFAKLFTGKTENATVMGPIGIAGEITKTSSIFEFIYLMSAISLSLGICNLLPIPGLDGRKVFIYYNRMHST